MPSYRSVLLVTAMLLALQDLLEYNGISAKNVSQATSLEMFLNNFDEVSLDHFGKLALYAYTQNLMHMYNIL